MKRTLYSIFLLLVLLISCKQTEETTNLDEQRLADSLALHVAVLPTLGTLPLYYADRMGVADSMGLDLRLHRYTSLMDVDTAFYHHHVHLFTSDSVRLSFIQNKWAVKALFAVPEPLSLLLKRDSPHQKLTGLFEETIGISRHCADETWCLQLIDSARISIYDVYRPQIHDIILRTQMLQGHLLDAAILMEPYSSFMHQSGCPLLSTCTNLSLTKTLFASSDSLVNDEYRMQQISLFEQIYNKASDMINGGIALDSLRAVLRDDYGFTPEKADSVNVPATYQLFVQ